MLTLPLFAGAHAQRRCQATACALTAHHDLAVVDAELRGVLLYPAKSAVAVLQRRRVGRFVGQTVADAHHHRVVLFHQRQLTGEIGHFRHAGSIAAAVNPENAGGRAGSFFAAVGQKISILISRPVDGIFLLSAVYFLIFFAPAQVVFFAALSRATSGGF